MDTDQVMGLALKMSGFERVPADSGVWVSEKRVRRALFAIDAGAAEIMLAREKGYDLVIAHHPLGPARVNWWKVAKRHTEFMVEKGVPRETADKATREIMAALDVGSHPSNYMHDIGVARQVGVALMNIHQPIDQITRRFLLKEINESSSGTLDRLIGHLSEIREFRKAKTRIELRMGSGSNPVGNWALVFAAGTNGGYGVARAYFDHGVDTVVYLHVDNDSLGKLKKDGKGNLVVLGHMAGDSIGINIFVEALRRKGVEVDLLDVIG